MAIAEVVSIDESESYSGSRQPSRIRLTEKEASQIRYVLCEWSGELMGSSGAAQAEQLAAGLAAAASGSEQFAKEAAKARRKRLRAAAVDIQERWRIAWEDDAQRQYINPSHSTSFHGWEMTPADRWCDDRIGFARTRREGHLRAWRTLRKLAERHAKELVVLNALYGDRPPGMPARGIFGKDRRDKGLDEEYRRVVRYVDGSGGTAAAIESRILVDERYRAGESVDARAARLGAARNSREEFLHHLAQGCERLIVGASVAYRAAWRDVS